MEHPARILIAFSILLVLCMTFAGCSDSSTQGTPSGTTAASGGPLYSEGDIVQSSSSSSSSTGLLIIGYDSATDTYTRAIIRKNTNGSWGYRSNSDTSTIGREELEKVYTVLAAHVSVSSIPTQAPTVVATTAATVKTTATTAKVTTTTTASTAKPTVGSTDPDEANQGDSVSVDIPGTNFKDGATVKLERDGQEDIEGEDVEWISATKLECTFDIPDDAEVGTWDVVVTNPDGKSGTNSNWFRVKGTASSGSSGDPVITEIDPESGSQGESVEVEITGIHFDEDATVRLERSTEDDIEGDVEWVSATTLICTFDIPDDAEKGYWAVVVTNPDNSYDKNSNAFRITS